MRPWRWAAAAALALAAGSALAQGLVKEPEAAYRSFPVTSRFRSFLPPEVDLSAAFPRPGQQGDQPSCVAWAAGYNLRSYYEHWRRGWDVSDNHHLVSPAYIYDTLAAKSGGCSAGLTIPDALNLMQSAGAASLADAPYNPKQCRVDMSTVPADETAGFRIDSWQRVDVSVLDNVKGELHNGNPVLFGMELSQSFFTLKGDRVYDDMAAPRTIGHAMLLVGYSEQRQAFKLVNSWGTGWGDKGFGWISYRAFGKFVDRAYVVRVSGTPPLETFMAGLQSPEAHRPATVAAATHQPPPTPEKPAAKAPAKTEDQSPPDLARDLKQFNCADVALEDTAQGPRVAGFVASADDRARIEDDLKRLDAAKRPADEVAVRPWPQCEALLSFAEPIAAPHGLTLAVNGGAPAELHAGEAIVLDVTTPDFPSYLYVTYVQASGDAVHLYRPAGTLVRALAPGSHVRIGGGGPDQPELRVGPPFGAEMVVVVAAASPLFTAARPEQEYERDFLTAYRAAYIARSAGGLSGRLVAASVLTVNTVATGAK